MALLAGHEPPSGAREEGRFGTPAVPALFSLIISKSGSPYLANIATVRWITGLREPAYHPVKAQKVPARICDPVRAAAEGLGT